MLLFSLLVVCSCALVAEPAVPPAADGFVNDVVTAKEPFVVGGLSYRVARIAFSTKIAGNQYSQRVAPRGSEFLVVEYEVRNDGSATVPSASSTIVVKDAPSGQTFEPAQLVQQALRQGATRPVDLPAELAPGAWSPATTGFVVPSDLAEPVVTFGAPSSSGSRYALFPPYFERSSEPAPAPRRP